MNEKPVLLRAIIAAVVILVFAVSMIPLTERPFFDTFKSMVKKDAPQADAIIQDAQVIKQANPDLYDSEALLKAAADKGVELKSFIADNKNIEDNRDVVGAIRKNAASSIRLGLDLAGGVEYLIRLVPDEEFNKKFDTIADGEAARTELKERMEDEFSRYRDMAIEILRKRLESQKIFESEISPSGSEHISLKAPLVSKDEKVQLLKLIQMSAKLRFRLVHKDNMQLVSQYLADPKGFQVPNGYELMTYETFRKGQSAQTEYYFVEKRAQMDGKGIIEAHPTSDQFGQRMISLRFDGDGAAKFGEITTKYSQPGNQRQLAIVLDGKLYCAPVLKEPITTGQAQISGSFSNEELQQISNALVSGSFPFQIKVDAVFDTDPKLGADNIQNSIYAGIAALITVVIFMIIYYRFAGFVAVLALGTNVILVLGALAAFDSTLTLPGMAGIILTIGMAVDANVLIFERIREELENGKSLAVAVESGYAKAFSAVFDANITTLFVAIILMNFGTGPVKGFAVTLGIGIISSLFTAIFLTHLVFDFILRFTSISTLKMQKFLKNPSFDFIKRKAVFFSISAFLIIGSFAVCAIRGTDMLSVDFTGGTLQSFNYIEKVPVAQVEQALKSYGIPGAVTYKSNSGTTNAQTMEILVRQADESKIKSLDDTVVLLNRSFPDAKFTAAGESTVGGLIGWEFTKSAIIALVLSFIGIIVYVTFRYEFAYAMASVLALIHDVIIAVGIYVVCGRELSLTVVAAVLTVIGYSINDTIVIFDRIRENVDLHPEKSYIDVVNMSVNDTLNRTMLTSITTLLVVLVLFFFGGAAINDFVLVMLLGVVIGTYSSICISSPIVSVWHKKIGKNK